MGVFCGLVAVAIIVTAVVEWMAEEAKKKEMDDLKTNNPALWLQAKQMEHEERLMEHQKQLMHHDGFKTKVGIGAFIASLFMKK